MKFPQNTLLLKGENIFQLQGDSMPTEKYSDP